MGCDIDKGVARKPANAKGTGTPSRRHHTLRPILAEIAWQADTFVLNPPFSINGMRSASNFSARASHGNPRELRGGDQEGQNQLRRRDLPHGLGVHDHQGRGYIILSETIARAYFGNPRATAATSLPAAHLLWLSIPGSIFQNCNSIDTAVLYFARDHRRDGKIEHRTARPTPLPAPKPRSRTSKPTAT